MKTRPDWLATTLVVIALVSWGAALAQEGTPSLTEIQRLQVQNKLQEITIAQQQAQLAQLNFERARTELDALLKTVQVEGYDLDLQRLIYVPRPTEPKDK